MHPLPACLPEPPSSMCAHPQGHPHHTTPCHAMPHHAAGAGHSYHQLVLPRGLRETTVVEAQVPRLVWILTCVSYLPQGAVSSWHLLGWWVPGVPVTRQGLRGHASPPGAGLAVPTAGLEGPALQPQLLKGKAPRGTRGPKCQEMPSLLPCWGAPFLPWPPGSSGPYEQVHRSCVGTVRVPALTSPLGVLCTCYCVKSSGPLCTDAQEVEGTPPGEGC